MPLYNLTSHARIRAIGSIALLSALPLAASTITSQLGSAGPGSWAIVTNSNNPHINGPGMTNGNVAITNPTGKFNLDNPNGVNGNVVLAPGATLANTGTITGSVSYTLPTNVLMDAQGAETTFTNLGTGLSPISITGTQTINSSGPGATNVFNVSNFNLGSNVLTLNGGASDQFIFDITSGGLTVNSGKVVLTGGLLPSDVLFNVESGDLSTSGGLNNESVITGIVLVGNGNVNMSPGQVNGELISLTTGTFQIVSGANVNSPQTPSVPEPQTYSMAGLGLLVLAGIGWRRRVTRSSQTC
jgi:MYXO-CTERM domain-containing protein